MYELRIYPDTLGAKAPEETLVMNDGEIADAAACDAAQGFNRSGRTEYRIEVLRDGVVELSIAR